MTTAGILIIGNEILTAKVQDENAPFLLSALCARGIDVARVLMLPDVVDEIAEELRRFSQAYDYVLTTGGVGPTHDDVTMEAVAAAFSRPLVLSAEMEASLRSALRDVAPNDSQLKMCRIPSGAKLTASRDLWFPVVQVENAYVFPGIPRLLRSKFEAVAHQFVGTPVILRNVYLGVMESEIASALYALLAQFPELRLGSYPSTERSHDYRTRITLESRDRSYVESALAALLAKVPQGALLRVD